MSRNDTFFTLDATRYDATLPTSHPPPRGKRTASSGWDDESNAARPTDSCEESHGAVNIGSTVEIRDLDTDDLEVYTIVHPDHADILRNRISSFTPIGRALYGRSVGEIVHVDGPNGAVPIRIESIRCRCMPADTLAGS